MLDSAVPWYESATGYTWPLPSEPPTRLLPHPTPLCCHRALGWAPRVPQQILTCYLFYIWSCICFHALLSIFPTFWNVYRFIGGCKERCIQFSLYISILYTMEGFPGGSEVKVSACNVGDPGSIPGSGRSPGEGNGNPLQYSCLEYPMDGGAWQATVHGVAKSRTRLSDFTHSLHIHYGTISTPRSWWTVHRACSDFSSYIWTHLCMLCVCVSVCVLCNFITL